MLRVLTEVSATGLKMPEEVVVPLAHLWLAKVLEYSEEGELQVVQLLQSFVVSGY